MSFSSDAKIQLCKVKMDETSTKKAEMYGLLLFSKEFSVDSISLSTENRSVCNLLVDMLAELDGVIVDVTTRLYSRGKKDKLFTIEVPDQNDRYKILSDFGHEDSRINLRINRGNLEFDEQIAAFLRGAFLSCGYITDPSCGYNIEFCVPFMHLANDLVKLISDIEHLNIRVSITNRKGMFVIYIRGSEDVTDLLAYIGANKAAMDTMQVKMLKEVRNYINRTNNFETANISKTVNASTSQIEAIKKIKNKKGIDWLPENLREIAQLRLDNPELSLKELSELLSYPISRSGVNHRIKRILEISETL